MHKDTAKLLLGLVPVSTLVGIAVALAPRFDEIRAIGVERWAGDHVAVASGVVVAFVGVLGVVVAGCYVLLAAPGKWSTLRADTDWFSAAFSDHAVGVPYYLDSNAFGTVESAIEQKDQGVTNEDREAVAKVTQSILDLSERLGTKRRFRYFGWAYVICIAAIALGVGTVLARLPAAEAPIMTPTTVQLYLPASAEPAFVAGTGCRASQNTLAVAVGGSWDDPELRLYGAGCFDRRWFPHHSIDVVIAPR